MLRTFLGKATLALSLLLSSIASAVVVVEGDVDLVESVRVASQIDGSVTVTAPSFFETGGLQIGGFGTVGSVVVDGAGWLTNGSTQIGSIGGMASLSVQNGAFYRQEFGDASIGNGSGSVGLLRVVGEGSLANLGNPLQGSTLLSIGHSNFQGNSGVGVGIVEVLEGAELQSGRVLLGIRGNAASQLDGAGSLLASG